MKTKFYTVVFYRRWQCYIISSTRTYICIVGIVLKVYFIITRYLSRCRSIEQLRLDGAFHDGVNLDRLSRQPVNGEVGGEGLDGDGGDGSHLRRRAARHPCTDADAGGDTAAEREQNGGAAGGRYRLRTGDGCAGGGIEGYVHSGAAGVDAARHLYQASAFQRERRAALCGRGAGDAAHADAQVAGAQRVGPVEVGVGFVAAILVAIVIYDAVERTVLRQHPVAVDDERYGASKNFF